MSSESTCVELWLKRLENAVAEADMEARARMIMASLCNSVCQHAYPAHPASEAIIVTRWRL